MSPMPILSYDEAQLLGVAVHDHVLRMTGAAPIARDDLGWADLVQFVTRKACECVVEREAERSGCPFEELVSGA